MPRPIDPEAPYRMRIHRQGKYVYASTQPARTDPKTGKRIHAYAHWGRLDPETKRFSPNKAFLMLTVEEQEKFIFPEDWDLTELEELTGLEELNEPGALRPERVTWLADETWFLGHLARRTGLRSDLLAVFNEDEDLVNVILTLAFYRLSTNGTYSGVKYWQRIALTPSGIELTEERINGILDGVSLLHFEELLRCRPERFDMKELHVGWATERNKDKAGWRVLALVGNVRQEISLLYGFHSSFFPTTRPE